MAKNILIPIDFKVESLNTLRLALEGDSSERANIILAYAAFPTTSISSLLFYSPHKTIRALLNPEFSEAISIVKNRYESVVSSIRIELLHWNTQNAFSNFLESNKIDRIVIPKSYKLQSPTDSFDIIRLMKKSGHPIQEVDWMPTVNSSQSQQLHSLFK